MYFILFFIVTQHFLIILTNHPSPPPHPCPPLPSSSSPIMEYWDHNRQKCITCTRCQDSDKITWSPCTLFTDTLCVSKQKWIKYSLKNERGFPLNNKDFDEGRLVYVADKPRVKQVKTFGKVKLTSEMKKKNTIFNFLNTEANDKKIEDFDKVYKFGVPRLFSDYKKNSSDNEAVPDNHNNEAFKLIMELMEDEDASEQKNLPDNIAREDQQINTSKYNNSSTNNTITHNKQELMRKEEKTSEKKKKNIEEDKAREENNKSELSGIFPLIIVSLCLILVACLIFIIVRKSYNRKQLLSSTG